MSHAGRVVRRASRGRGGGPERWDVPDRDHCGRAVPAALQTEAPQSVSVHVAVSASAAHLTVCVCVCVCVCESRAVQESPVVRMSMWKEAPASGLYVGVRR